MKIETICPRCKSNKTSSNHYWKAIQKKCNCFCNNCLIHFNSKTNKYWNDGYAKKLR